MLSSIDRFEHAFLIKAGYITKTKWKWKRDQNRLNHVMSAVLTEMQACDHFERQDIPNSATSVSTFLMKAVSSFSS